MSNQALNSFEGLTFKIIGQVVDVTYHGVDIITQKGNGVLGKMIQPIINQGTPDRNSVPTTKSMELMQLPFSEVQSGSSHLSKVRAQIIAENAVLNAKISDFHSKLNSLKEGLLQGREMGFADHKDLDAIKEAMKAYNVGKVLKLKLQARGFTHQDIPEWNRVKTGGSSQVRVVYTLYVPYNDEDDLQAIVNQYGERFKSGQLNPDLSVEHQAYKALVTKREDDQVVITPQIPKTVVRFTNDETGKVESLPVEDIKKSSDSLRKSSLFTRTTRAISSDPTVRD